MRAESGKCARRSGAAHSLVQKKSQDGIVQRLPVVLGVFVDEYCDLLRGPLAQHSVSLPLAAGCQKSPQPDAQIAQDNAARQVQHAHPAGAVPHGLVNLILEAGKSGVPSKNAYHQK